MKYGQGFWVVVAGRRLKTLDPVLGYPGLNPFEYADGSGDVGWLHTRDFTVDYVKPGDNSGSAWRITLAGDLNPVQYLNSFDFDGASRPEATKAITRDKMDHRWIVAADLHDLGYCIHEWKTGFTKADWDTLLSEVAEAYGENAYERAKYWAAVTLGGWACWPKTAEETERYRNLCSFERVPL